MLVRACLTMRNERAVVKIARGMNRGSRGHNECLWLARIGKEITPGCAGGEDADKIAYSTRLFGARLGV
jgi:hypothetical protein